MSKIAVSEGTTVRASTLNKTLKNSPTGEALARQTRWGISFLCHIKNF